LQVLEKNRSNLQNVYNELNEIFKAGFVEKLDVERIELSLQQLDSEKEN
jgi:outer membrane protein